MTQMSKYFWAPSAESDVATFNLKRPRDAIKREQRGAPTDSSSATGVAQASGMRGACDGCRRRERACRMLSPMGSS
eukprot:scaffold120550_cov28-Tisochrysis_lutea.AAC.1